MTVQLSASRGYGAYLAGTIVTLPASTEAALIAQNLATSTASTPTTGAVSSNEFAGRVAFAAAATSLVVTNPNVTASSKVSARINQAAADATMLSIARVVPAAGSFTLYANAAATAATVVDWEVDTLGGLTPNS
jgi:hypothetical protein